MHTMKKVFLMLVTVFIGPATAFARGGDDWHMGGWGHMMDFGYGGAFMWFIFLVLIGFVIYFIVQGTKAKSPESPAGETPLDIIKKRYARGEITKEEFDDVKKDLGS